MKDRIDFPPPHQSAIGARLTGIEECVVELRRHGVESKTLDAILQVTASAFDESNASRPEKRPMLLQAIASQIFVSASELASHRMSAFGELDVRQSIFLDDHVQELVALALKLKAELTERPGNEGRAAT